MEFKFIIYLVGGILYYLYRQREARENVPPVSAPRPAAAPKPESAPKTIDDILREARKALEKTIEPAQPVKPVMPPPKPQFRPMQSMMKPEEEGVTDFIPDVLKTTAYTPISELQVSEGLSEIKSIKEIMREEDEGIATLQIDLRQALIYQTILERKFSV